jgi:hypothetical protein
MNLRRFIVTGMALCLVMYGPGMALAADDPLSYDDPGMHFRPPDGWERLQLSDSGPDQNGPRPPVAVYFLKKSKSDQRLITITVQPFTGSLDGFVNSRTSDLRKQSDSTFVEKQQKTTLSNGMPAYWLKVNQGASLGQYVRRYEYLVIDLTRGIVVSYTGRAGDFDEKEAKDALASLYVVVYPRSRS